MAFTPEERVSAADPVTRVVGHVTSSISLADEADYLLGAYTAGTYRVSFQDAAQYPVGSGDFEAEITFPELLDLNTQSWGVQSDGSASADSRLRASSMSYDDTGGAIENELLITTATPHNLVVGQYVSVVMDSDLTASTAFATGSTIGAISADYLVEVVSSTTIFSVSFTSGTGDDAADGDLDANVYVNPTGAVVFEKRIANITLLDTFNSEAFADVWDGEVVLQNRTENKTCPFICDAGTVDEAWQPDTGDNSSPLDYDSDGSDASQGLEVISSKLEVVNEDGATNVYDVILRNSPLKGTDTNGYVCLYVTTGSEMTLSNRLGAAEVFKIERVR